MAWSPFSYLKRNPVKVGAASFAVVMNQELVPFIMTNTGIPIARQITGTFMTPASPVIASTAQVGLGGRYANAMQLLPLSDNAAGGVGL